MDVAWSGSHLAGSVITPMRSWKVALPICGGIHHEMSTLPQCRFSFRAMSFDGDQRLRVATQKPTAASSSGIGVEI
jgi:hypothetical protein